MLSPVTGINLGRVALGTLAYARPDLAAQALQIDAKANPQLAAMSRLFGAREVALGAVTLIARGRTRRALLAVGVAVDAADAAAGYTGQMEGSMDRQAGSALVAVGAGAAGLGLLALLGELGSAAKGTARSAKDKVSRS